MKSVNGLIKALTISLVAVVFLTSFQFPVLRAAGTESNETQLAGSFYEWGKENSKYPFSTSKSVSTRKADTYGKFTLVGAIAEMDEHSGTPSYLVKGNTNVSFKYVYGNSKISKNDAGDVNWHITNDGNKKIDNDALDLGSKIKSGAIIIQTSLDGFMEEIQKIKDVLVEDDELSNAKNNYIGKLQFITETNAQQANFLAYRAMCGLGFKAKEELIKKVKSVTSEQIQNVAGKYLNDISVISILKP